MTTPAHHYAQVPIAMQGASPYQAPYPNPYDPYNVPRPALSNNPSGNSQASSVWPDSFIKTRSLPLTTRYGLETWLSLLASITLLGAVAFSLYASSTGLGVPVSALSGNTVNIPNLSALIAGSGSMVAAAFSFSLSLVGRYWILRQLRLGRRVTIGQWSAIASNGRFLNLARAGRIGGGGFLCIALLVKLVGTALSGALVPSLIMASSRSWVEEVRLSGSIDKLYMENMVPCDTDGLTRVSGCPATFVGPSIDSAISHGLTSVFKSSFSYFSIGDGRFENLEALSSQPQIQAAVERVPSSRLDNIFEASGVQACLPTVISTVACRLDIDPTTARRKNITSHSFEDMCGEYQELQTFFEEGAFTSRCNRVDDQHLLSYIRYNSTAIIRYDCSITADEEDAWTYYNYSSSMYRRGGSCGPSVPLNVTEMLPLVTSVTQKLELSPDSDGMNIYTILLDGSTDDQVKDLQDAISAGMGVAASGLYLSAINNFHLDSNQSDPFPAVDALVSYRAYGWERGYKTYIWDAILGISGLLALIGAALGTRPRLRYDPSDWAQTVFIGLNSKDLDPPLNSDTGALPKGCEKTTLQYGHVPGSQTARFTTAIPITSV